MSSSHLPGLPDLPDLPGPCDVAALAEFLPTATVRASEDTPAWDEAHQSLSDLLYQEWYLQATKPDPPPGPPQATEVNLVGALAAAHVASGRFEQGWVAHRSSTAGRVLASERHGAPHQRLTRTLCLGEYVNLAAPGQRPRAGDPLAVSAVHAEVEDGFWVARNRAWWALSASDALPDLSRVYLHVDLTHTTHAVRALSSALDEWDGPYAFKVSLGLNELQRPDSVVLYVPRDRFHDDVRDLLEPAVRSLADEGALGEARPRLTAALAPGVSAADGDAAGASFGVDRCRLVARALLRADSVDDIEPLVRHLLRESGLDPDRPYLEGGETRDYIAYDHAR